MWNLSSFICSYSWYKSLLQKKRRKSLSLDLCITCFHFRNWNMEMEFRFEETEIWKSVLHKLMTKWISSVDWSESWGKWASPAICIRKGDWMGGPYFRPTANREPSHCACSVSEMVPISFIQEWIWSNTPDISKFALYLFCCNWDQNLSLWYRLFGLKNLALFYSSFFCKI